MGCSTGWFCYREWQDTGLWFFRSRKVCGKGRDVLKWYELLENTSTVLGFWLTTLFCNGEFESQIPSNQKAVPRHGGTQYVLDGMASHEAARVWIPSLKLTWPLQMDGWNTTFLLGRPIFRGYVSFREGNFLIKACLSEQFFHGQPNKYSSDKLGKKEKYQYPGIPSVKHLECETANVHHVCTLQIKIIKANFTLGLRATQAYLDAPPEWECTNLIFQQWNVTPRMAASRISCKTPSSTQRWNEQKIESIFWTKELELESNIHDIKTYHLSL